PRRRAPRNEPRPRAPCANRGLTQSRAGRESAAWSFRRLPFVLEGAPLDHDVLRRTLTTPPDGQGHLASDITAELLVDLFWGHFDYIFPIDRHDFVPLLHPGPCGAHSERSLAHKDPAGPIVLSKDGPHGAFPGRSATDCP